VLRVLIVIQARKVKIQAVLIAILKVLVALVVIVNTYLEMNVML
jgi:hypothetical protein